VYRALIICAGLHLFRQLLFRIVDPIHDRLSKRDSIIEGQKQLDGFARLADSLWHDIREPLTTMNARLYLVQRSLKEGTPESKDAKVIGNEIDRINIILRRFVQSMRPAPDKLALVTAESLLNDVAELMAPQLKPLRLSLECQSQDQAQSQGEPQQLKQVLINLVQNAAEAIVQDGTIRLRVRAGKARLNGKKTVAVLIEVEDTGPGIPAEVRDRLFHPFLGSKNYGIGLGLPIAARIIEGHGGAITFKSSLGHGTTFTVVLPSCEKP